MFPARLSTGLLLPGACVALSACAPALRLETAPPLASTEWSAPTVPAVATEPRGNLGAAFGSETLAELIERGRRGSPEVGIAAARVDQARALLRVARAAMLPTVSLSAGLSGTRSSRAAVDPYDFSEGFGGVDVAYDLDLFGGAAAGRRANRERLGAALLDREALLIVIEAEIARAWLQRATLSDRIELVERNIVQAVELERIIRARLNAGDASRVDLGLQTIQVRQLQAEKVRLEQALGNTRTALAVLVGEEAPRFTSAPGALAALEIPAFDPGSPGELLVRRPDIRAAEARIAAAGGDVSQARAAFFPRLRLSASGLGQAASLGNPITSLLSIGADLLAPIFNRGRLRGEYALATAQQRESVELYRRTLLTALAEVEDAMSAVDRSAARERLILDMVEEARLTARLSRLQYIGGEADLRQVLDAEERLIAAEDARAIVLQQRLEAAVDMFRATGGRLESQNQA